MSFWGHFGHPNGCQIDTGTSLGSHRSPRRPPERPGVPFGSIWGSFWGQFWDVLGHIRYQNDTIVGTDFATFWPLFGSMFGRIVDHFRCPEASAVEKGEHVTFDDSCTFSYDLQGPQETEN